MDEVIRRIHVNVTLQQIIVELINFTTLLATKMSSLLQKILLCVKI